MLQSFVDIKQGWRRRRGRPNGEGQSMRLIDSVIWILTKYHYFDCVQGSMSRPGRTDVSFVGDLEG